MVSASNRSSQTLQFWEWFRLNEREIIRAVESRDHHWLREQIGPRVVSLKPADLPGPRLNWEMGPGFEKPWRFSLSPLTRENLEITTDIVAHAPRMDKWEFFPAKPPRPSETFEYTLADETDERYTFHARNWEYILLDHGKGFFSVRLLGKVPEGMDEAFRKKAAYLIVEGALGEEFAIKHIVDVHLFSPAEVDTDLPRTKLIDLKRHLHQLILGEARQ